MSNFHSAKIYILSIARTLERADIRTTQALNTKLRREEHFVRKDLGNARAHQFYQEAITLGTNSMTTLKTKIKSAINADQSKAWLDHLKKLVVQGDLLNLAHSEESDITWLGIFFLSIDALVDSAACINEKLSWKCE